MDTHQIPMPENKAMKYFLWLSYFHDSLITAIEFKRKGNRDFFFSPNRVELTIVSIRDIDNDQSIPDDYQKGEEYLKAHRDRYTYKLVFDGCVYFNNEKYFHCGDFVHGVFLDSARLRTIHASDDTKRYYHYRITLADGYMDLIFHRFTIKRVIGKVKYPDIEPMVDYPKWQLEWLLRESTKDETAALDTAWVTSQLESEDDEVIAHALLYLARNENRCVVEEARKIMKKPWPAFSEAREAAMWVLGQQGDECDLPILLQEYFSLEERYAHATITPINVFSSKRFVMDAIEHIKARFPTNIEKEPEQSGPI